jgi:hypothetical protein
MKKLLLVCILLLAPPAFGYEVSGVSVGGKELDVKKAFPSVHCKPLEWKSDAADRRCDDAQVSLGGVQAKITVFIKADVIQAYDLRFDIKELDRVTAFLKSRWGAPLSEATEIISKKDKPDRKVFKVLWEKGAERAVLVAQLEQKRGAIEVARGGFPDEIYRVK